MVAAIATPWTHTRGSRAALPRFNRQRGTQWVLLFALALLAGVTVAGCGFGPSPTDLSAGARPPGELAKAGRGLGTNWLSTPVLFASGPRMYSLAATPTRLLATTDGMTTPTLVSITDNGTLEPFGKGLLVPAGTPSYVEIAPGVGNFIQGTVLLGAGLEVWLIAPEGQAAEALAALPAGNGDIAGVTFDTVGAFHNDLLALTTLGAVYRVDVDGHTYRIGDVGPGGRGPSIAPSSFGHLAGQLLVAFPATHDVRALDATGNVSLAVRWSGVSGAWAVPDSPRGYCDTGSTLFLATATGQIYRYPLKDLTARAGSVLLTSALCSGSGLSSSRSDVITTLAFSRYMGGEVAAAFVRRPAVTVVNLEIQPGVTPKTIIYGSTALLPVAIFASPGFAPRVLEGGDVWLAGASVVETPRHQIGTYQDVNGDGRLDLVVQFRPSEMQLQEGDATLVLEATALVGDQVRGSANVRVFSP
jgi:hypothetical protein